MLVRAKKYARAEGYDAHISSMVPFALKTYDVLVPPIIPSTLMLAPPFASSFVLIPKGQPSDQEF